MSDRGPDRRRRRKSQEGGVPLWVTGLFVAALIITMVWVIDRFSAYDKLQRCVTAGHRDCGGELNLPK
ncbi:MAG: hypothetical protein P4L82_16800 [Ancalomicrobiaceae bacterium]|nr:hypothetical protein [Ancalomicrobiaceae bacterium]